MELKLSPNADDDEFFLFERVIGHLQHSYSHGHEHATMLVNQYYSKFTDAAYCHKYQIPVQTVDFFCHIEARGMADRVQYYEVLDHLPDEAAFIVWQRKQFQSSGS
ncbi:MAG: hypothetical protein Q7T36_09125 [Fluviicoccus sp.]|uniref:hypothetical protein n=1 Tax=Fluviicoccus sp. TaxID=2003552 RepID=UPI002728C754|nr:hypothetical protein [Fluviicoccus sp.]MDO8330619.1 hypothetical protein [Fluviicoccus sp.]